MKSRSATSEPGLTYVLVTPARNEAEFIELTLNSVVQQTARPLRWVIVSDGSADGTDEIVTKYAKQHDWIELVRAPERSERHFAGKVHAFNAGYARLQGLQYDIIGNLDADLSFDPGYFQFLLGKFAENPRLGVAGAPFKEGNDVYDFRFSSIEHVSGASQLFRRQCFDDIGGYTPIKGGGIDVVAVLTARMKGWQTRTFPEKVLEHHRPMGTAKSSTLKTWFRQGKKDYSLGGHPAWQVFRSVYQMLNRPFVIGGGLILAGYFWSVCRRAERPVSREFVQFRRREQMHRLKQFISRRKMPSRPAESMA